MRYEPSNKHKRTPAQPGRKGTLCPDDMTVSPQHLLDQSATSPKYPQKRWATDGERAYCAHRTREDVWHGWPVRFDEVPADVLRTWEEDGAVTRRAIRQDRLIKRRTDRERKRG
jgi:hypothetical protein